jgi:hypothetical protein
MVFNRVKSNTVVQVIFRATFWTRTWSLLCKDAAAKDNLKRACRVLESVIMEVFAKFGWSSPIE